MVLVVAVGTQLSSLTVLHMPNTLICYVLITRDIPTFDLSAQLRRLGILLKYACNLRTTEQMKKLAAWPHFLPAGSLRG